MHAYTENTTGMKGFDSNFMNNEIRSKLDNVAFLMNNMHLHCIVL